VQDDKNCESEISAPPSIDLNDRKQIESQIGRKLKLKERIALSFLKSDIKKNAKKAQQANTPDEGSKTDGFAIAGFVLGLLSLFIAGIPLGILAIVFSAISMGRIDKSQGSLNGKGFAIAGLILGIVGVVGAIIVLGAA
jgi:hypothetical protein